MFLRRSNYLFISFLFAVSACHGERAEADPLVVVIVEEDAGVTDPYDATDLVDGSFAGDSDTGRADVFQPDTSQPDTSVPPVDPTVAVNSSATRWHHSGFGCRAAKVQRVRLGRIGSGPCASLGRHLTRAASKAWRAHVVILVSEK